MQAWGEVCFVSICEMKLDLVLSQALLTTDILSVHRIVFVHHCNTVICIELFAALLEKPF